MIQDLQTSNTNLNLVRGQRKSIKLSGTPGESVFLEGPSALENQREYVWLVTAERDRGLFYLIMISPEREYDALYPEFEKTVNSVTFTR